MRKGIEWMLNFFINIIMHFRKVAQYGPDFPDFSEINIYQHLNAHLSNQRLKIPYFFI
jgi:hypothetical protein